LDYVKLKLFKIIAKILEIIYRLNLLEKMKIYLVQYVIILELAYRDLKLLVYKADIYKSQKEDEWLVKKIINYEDINNKM